VSEHLHRAHGGLRGVQGGGAPRAGVWGQRPRKKKFGPTYFRDHMILGGFRHMVFADGFLFSVKELGFWTNLGHWVRVLDAAGSYMYIVL